jgi:5-methylcytosine-specific restriction endonuclease McrA
VSKLRQRIPRLKLPLADYRVLRHQVLKRDGWRCQLCGKSTNLHVHHVKSRSKLGHDALRNLITLCAKCHETSHHRIQFLVTD